MTAPHFAGVPIGLAGVGPWGANILRDLRSLGAEVHAVARSPESIARARDGGAASITDSAESLPACAGYVVANRTISHLDAIEALLDRGKPIFCEKPLAIDVARAKRLPPAAHDLVFVMHKWRYHPGIRALAEIAAQRPFGAVLGLRTMRSGWGNPHPDANSLWILAPHELSIALTVFGETPRVTAAWPDPLSGADAAITHLRTSTGIPIVMEVGSFHPTPLRRMLLRCADAVCQLDSSRYDVVTVRFVDGGATQEIAVDDAMPLLLELEAFLRHVMGGPAPMSSLREEFAIIDAVAEIERLIASAT